MNDHLLFDPTDSTTIADTHSVGAFVRSGNDGTLITYHTLIDNEKARLISQGIIFRSKLAGTVGNAYSFQVIDSGSGAISYTEVAGAIIVNLKGNTPTVAQVVTLLSSSAFADVSAGSPLGNVVLAGTISFAGGKDSSLHQHLDVYQPMVDGYGNPISSTGGALDVNLKSPVVVNVDLNGIYSGGNLLPDNVGIIGSSRAAPGLANQTLQFTGGGVSSDAVPTANIVAQDVNSFNMGWNGTTWDRIKSLAGSMVTHDDADGSVGPGAAGSYSQLGGGIYNSSPITMTNGQQAALQFNANGYLKVDLASSSGTLAVSDAALANIDIFNDVKVLATQAVAQAAVTAALANRKYLWIYNNDNTKVFIGKTGVVSAANGFPISPGSYMELRAGAAISPFFVGQANKTPEIRTLELS
jgi:hypothetical protein